MADDALLMMMSTNPIKIVLRLGQIMVLNTLAIDIFGFFFAMIEVELKWVANKGIKLMIETKGSQKNCEPCLNL